MSRKRVAGKKRLPDTVELGFMVITFGDLPRPQGSSNIAGIWVGSTEEILVDETLSGRALVNTVLHELFHAMWSLGEIREADASEEFSVSVLSNLLTELFQRNPHLIEWIQETL